MSRHRHAPLALAAVAPRSRRVDRPLGDGGLGGHRHDTYVVLADDGASIASARAAVTAAGGQVVGEVAEIGAVIATSNRADFAEAADAQAAVAGVARDRVIGSLPETDTPNAGGARRGRRGGVQGTQRSPRPGSEGRAIRRPPVGHAPDRRDARGLVRRQPGRRGVLVGVLDSGIDGNHPDIAPNFNKKLSRNFVTDMPDIDGPCEHPSCVDPVDEDDNGHGTHVAGRSARRSTASGSPAWHRTSRW